MREGSIGRTSVAQEKRDDERTGTPCHLHTGVDGIDGS